MDKSTVDNIMLGLTIRNECLKSADMIADYSLSAKTENYKVAHDGVLEYDVNITNNILTNPTPKVINISFEIKPISDVSDGK